LGGVQARETAEGQRPTSRRAPALSDSALDVLGHLQGIIDLDTEVAEMFSCTFSVLSAESGYVLKIR